MKNLIILISFFTFYTALGQSSKSFVKAGKKSFKQSKYEAAVYYFSKALEIEPNVSVAWLTAEAARYNKDYEIAEKWYQYIAENAIDKYPLAYFWLGLMQKHLAKYQKAQINFRRYVQKNAAKKDYYTLKARHEILSCEQALLLSFEKKDVPIFTFDSTINTIFSEFQANIDKDSLLWITTYSPLKHEDSINFTSKLLSYKFTENHWQMLSYDTIINSTQKLISSFCFNKSNEILIFSGCQKTNSQYNCKLYKSHKNQNKWQPPIELAPSINVGYTTHPHLIETDTAMYLIFSSDRKGGFGKLDLWAVKVNYNIEPIDSIFNLGKNINSIDNECCPFYDVQKKVLYYSSEWFINLGGYDIFSSNGWITHLYPSQNLGFPFNTNHDEVFFQISPHRTRALFASNRGTHQLNSYEKCCNNIYYLEFEKPQPDTIKKKEEIVEIKRKTEDLIPVTLYFHNDEPNPRTWDTTTQYTYTQLYERYIQMREEYINVYSASLKGEQKQLAESKIDAFFTDEVEKNYIKLIQFFNYLKQLLAEGSTVSITIKGYASPLNNHAYNLNLSKRRVQSLVNLLYSYEDGVFTPYIENKATNGGRLIIIREAFGENMVKEGVSDDLRDVRNSVYSPEASRERKIAVIAVKFENQGK
ncbi:MAG: hypothetical protein N2449_02750 [Bacteroidales bacterium]|nr:hypothetical protein [Bacteroidales bacterium]